jgi:hypothetical protein
MPKIRVRGLVRAMNEVRQRLAAGIPRTEAAAFRRQVRGVVANVEQLCRQNRITPSQLPPPSFRAYTFLKTLDLADLPLIDRERTRPDRQLRVKNLVSFCNMVQGELDKYARLAADEASISGKHARAGLIIKIKTRIKEVETLTAQAGDTPSALPIRTRRAYQWLNFLSEPLTLEAHLAQLAAVHRITAEAAGRQPVPARRGKTYRFELYHTSHLYRIRQEKPHTRVVIHEGYIGAPQIVLKALVRITLGLNTKADDSSVREYAASDDFSEVVQALEATSLKPNGFTQGRVYDLETVFDRVNTRYFGGHMPRPQLTWNATLSKRIFGHYQPAADTVMISITLDDPRVPKDIIEFVMYHELLHKKLGVQIRKGRRYAHTQAFRDKEMLFHAYEEARAFLNQLARE